MTPWLLRASEKEVFALGSLKCSFDHEFKYPREARDDDDRRNDRAR